MTKIPDEHRAPCLCPTHTPDDDQVELMVAAYRDALLSDEDRQAIDRYRASLAGPKS